MSFTAVGHNPALSIHNVGDTSPSNVTAGNAFALTTHNVGNLIVVINTDHTTTSVPNGISDSLGLATWTKASSDFTNESNTNLNLDGSPVVWNGNIWFGTVVSVGGPSTVTFSYSGGSTPAFTNSVGMEFTVTSGVWSLDAVGVFNVNTGQSSWPFPSAAGSGELAIGFAWDSSSASSGTTSGWTYNQNADLTNNGMAYNLSVGPGSVTGPTWADSNECWGLMVLVAEGSPSPPSGVVRGALLPVAGPSLPYPQAASRLIVPPTSSSSASGYATAAGTVAGGTGSWVNTASADGAPDGSYATWTAP